jgi:predicted ribosome quality control (RQC) complex YloA/Tae2 family protein
VYVLKLARSGEDGDKVLLLVESGSRLHTVPAMPPKADTPSNFSLKLRKHVRSRRVESIRQLGVDRVVQITFGTGDATYHLLLEFYAQGNVILCDGAYEVLTLLRSHRDDAKGSATMARHTYPIHTIRLRTPLPPAALEEALAGAAEGSTLKGAVQEVLPYGPLVAAHVAMRAGLDPGRPLAAAPLDEAEREALLAAVRGWERWLDACDGDGGGPPPGGAVLTRPAPAAAAAALPGDATSADNADAAAAAVAYDEFEPLLEGGRPLEPHAGAAMLTFDTFDAAAAEFYGSLAGQRAAAAQAARERAAAGKLGAIKRDHEARLAALSGDVGGAERRAALIELNLAGVDAALNAVREALAGGMDWGDLGRMVKEERRAGNPVAGLIDALHLDRNKLTLALRDPLEEEEEQEEEDDEAGGGAGGAAGSGAAAAEDEQAGGEEEEEEEDGGAQVKGKGKKSKAAAKGKEKPQGGGGGKGGVTKVEVDLDLSAYANARAHFDARRKAADKARRTLDANKQALAAAEARAAEALAKVVHAGGGARAGGASAAAAAARKPYWFERFHWFVSSENYLVLSGRDAQQNELLVKRYMRCARCFRAPWCAACCQLAGFPNIDILACSTGLICSRVSCSSPLFLLPPAARATPTCTPTCTGPPPPWSRTRRPAPPSRRSPWRRRATPACAAPPPGTPRWSPRRGGCTPSR